MIIFITGASAGIGKATANIFAKHGHDVIITGRRKEKLDDLKLGLETAYNVEVLTLSFDIQDKDAVAEAVNSLDGKWKDVDVLVNNAGLALGKESFQHADLSEVFHLAWWKRSFLRYVSKVMKIKR